MTTNSESFSAGLDTCPSSPRPARAKPLDGVKARHGKDATAIAAANTPDDPTHVVPIAPPSGASGRRCTQGTSPGFENLRPIPPLFIRNQIQSAGTAGVLGNQQCLPPVPTINIHPPEPIEVSSGPSHSVGLISENRRATREAAASETYPQPRATFNSKRYSTGKGFGDRYSTGKNFGNRHIFSGMEKCHALASTRVYNSTLRCDRCGGRSSLGWYYRCCHETDTRLYESIQNGNDEHFDDIGEEFSKDMQQPVRGPAARQDKLSPLNELPASQIGSLSAPQLATILRQHETAVNTALEDRHGLIIPPAGEKPFLPLQFEECRTTLCPTCGRVGNGEQQALLSLDGVLSGDIPPAAAVGFGFRALGGRPVVNTTIVKKLGMRDAETGSLPGQKVNGSSAAGRTQGSGVDDSMLSERTAALNVDDAETYTDSDGLKTPLGSIKAGDSAEELVQLYMDSEEETLSGSFQEDPVEDEESTHWSQM